MPARPEAPAPWADIEQQHDDLLRRARSLRAAVEARDEAGALEAHDGLLEATILHFKFEEDLMERTGYPERVRHRGAHDLFLQDLHALGSELADAGLTAEVETWATERMPEWLSFHIQTNDAPLARHLQQARWRGQPDRPRTERPS
jgi:hemerythrin-like metal-binding protein